MDHDRDDQEDALLNIIAGREDDVWLIISEQLR
jgi:hypothetical protein